MRRGIDRLERVRRGRVAPLAMAAILLLTTSDAFALNFTLSQVGGTAVNGMGAPGDTIEVAVQVRIEAGEAFTGIFPVLRWDAEGGNVLDLRAVDEALGVQLGQAPFGPINGNSLVIYPGGATGSETAVFTDPTEIGDVGIGETLVSTLEFAPRIFDDDLLLLAVIENGLPGPLDIPMGVVTLELVDPGATTIGFSQDPTSPLFSVVSGIRGTLLPNDQIEFAEIPVSAVGFGTLQILVVPEPHTAVLLGLGLAGLAASREGRHAGRDRHR